MACPRGMFLAWLSVALLNRCTRPSWHCSCDSWGMGHGCSADIFFVPHPPSSSDLVLQLIQLLARWAWSQPNWECILPNLVARGTEVTYMMVESCFHQQVFPIWSNIDCKSHFSATYLSKNLGTSFLPKKRPSRERFTTSHRACNVVVLLGPIP